MWKADGLRVREAGGERNHSEMGVGVEGSLACHDRGPMKRTSLGVWFLMLCTAFACTRATDESTPSAAPVATEPRGTLAASAAASAGNGGLYVESVEDGLVAQRIGIRPGDVLLRWERLASTDAPAPGGPLVALGWSDLVTEHGQRGLLRVTGLRDGEPVEFEGRSDNWGLISAPWLEPDRLDRYLAARELSATDPAAAATEFEELARLVAQSDASVASMDAAYIHYRAAEAWRAADPSSDRWRQVAEEARTLAAGDVDAVAALTESEGIALYRLGRLASAAEVMRRAAEQRRARGRRLVLARTLFILSGAEWRGGNLDSAVPHIEEAIDIVENEAPESLVLARYLSTLARILAVRGDQDEAEPVFRRSLALRRELAPDTPEVTAGLTDLSALLLTRGDFAEAEPLLEEALELAQRFQVNERSLTVLLSNLGAAANARGDVVRAERYGLRSLELQRQKGPLTPHAAPTLGNLANTALSLGDVRTAEFRQREALELIEQGAAGSVDHGWALRRMAQIHRAGGDDGAAIAALQQSMEVLQATVPRGWQTALPRLDLAQLALDEGRLEEADRWLGEGIALLEAQAPGRRIFGQALQLEGELALELGQIFRARRAFQRGLLIYESVAPDTVWVARARYGLGRCELAEGRRRRALDEFLLGIAAVEAHQGRMSGPDGARIAEQVKELFAATVELLLEFETPQDAFLLIERFRRHQLEEHLLARDLRLSSLPEDLDRQRRRLDAEYRRALQRLLGSPSLEPDEEAELNRRLQELARERRLQRSELMREYRPSLLSASSEEPIVMPRLEAGSILLSYFLAGDRSVVFVVDAAGGVAADSLSRSEAEIEQLVRRNLLLLGAPGPPESVRALDQIGHELHEILIAPARGAMAAARSAGEPASPVRLLIQPHGVLHRLPFTALASDLAPEPRRLIDEASITYVSGPLEERSPNALDQDGSGRVRAPLVVLADPAVADEAAADSAARLGPESRRGPLPWARREAAALQSLVGAGSRVWLGADATATRALDALRGARWVHFAVHGWNDARAPMDGGLLLSPAEADSDDSLLQAWEMLEAAPLRAELATLASCESGLGTEVGLEAPFGVTRALQVAGVERVLAPLWEVHDQATAVLMERFYRQLIASEKYDDALRAAQLALSRGEVPSDRSTSLTSRVRGALDGLFGVERPTSPDVDYSHPYYWASFRLEASPR